MILVVRSLRSTARNLCLSRRLNGSQYSAKLTLRPERSINANPIVTKAPMMSRLFTILLTVESEVICQSSEATATTIDSKT